MRDISRKSKKKPYVKPTAKKTVVVIHTPKPAPPPLPTKVVAYIHKDDEGGWLGYVGDEDAAVTLHTQETPLKRMKDVVAWANEICEENKYELKEIRKI